MQRYPPFVPFHDAFPILHTPDAARLAAFYCDRLGFEAVYRFPEAGEPDYVSVELGDLRIGFAQQGSPAPAGRVVFWLYTGDVDAEIDVLRAAGVEITTEPADMAWGERLAVIADPDGNPVHLGQKL